MVTFTRRIALLAGGLALLAACGGGGSGNGGGGTTGSQPGFFIVIRNMTFTPTQLDVPPGATVTVVNMDTIPHTVTSQASAGAFTPGAVAGISFDTGAFTNATKTFTLPANAAEGTVIPYYCKIHTAAMNPPSPTIRVDSSAQPSPMPAGM